MATRQALVEDLQRLITHMGASGAASRPSPWLTVDLSMPQLKALMVLHHRGTLRVGEVARLLGLSPNATTTVLDRLEDDHLVQRRPDPSDRRAVLVGLTDTGEQWIAELLSANAQDFGQVLAQLSTEDLQALHQGLLAFSRVLDAEAASAEREYHAQDRDPEHDNPRTERKSGHATARPSDRKQS